MERTARNPCNPSRVATAMPFYGFFAHSCQAPADGDGICDIFVLFCHFHLIILLIIAM